MRTDSLTTRPVFANGRSVGPQVWRRCSSRFGLVIAAFGALLAGLSSAKTINQVPFTAAGITTPKFTRDFALGDTYIQRALFGALAGGNTLSFFDVDGNRVDLAVFLDTEWNRVVWAASGSLIRWGGGYGTAANQFKHPADMDLSPAGHLYIADTENNRVQMYAYVAQGPLTGTMLFELSIPGNSDFEGPEQVLWEDNGTVSSTDDVVWVLDPSHSRVAAYHIQAGSETFTYSPYIAMDLRGFGGLTYPIAITKGRSYTTPSDAGSYCTTDLYVYDMGTDRFVIYSVPRVTGMIPPAQIPTSVVMRSVANPKPGTMYRALSTDAWGNIYAVDQAHGIILKFDKDLNLLDQYGGYGAGPLGSEQALAPSKLAFHREDNVGNGTGYRLTNRASLSEFWSDSSGVQSLTMGVTAESLVVSPVAGSTSRSISYFTTDHAMVRVRIRTDPGGTTIRTLADGTVETPGAHSIIWNGANDLGAVAAPCQNYRAEVRAISLYASPETSIVSMSFYYKPPTVAQMRIQSNVPGSHFSFDGRDTTIAGTFAVYPCSLCTIHSPRAPAVQTISNVHYCFDRWSNGGYRAFHDIQVRGDSTVTLFLTSGPGPTYVGADSTLYDDAYDCKSPYRFLGSATLTTSSPTDTFRTWGNVKFRFPKVGGTALNVNRPLIAKGASFETVDSTSNANPNLWEGLRLGTNASLFLDSCFVRNGNYGITNCSGCTGVAKASVTRSSFTADQSIDVSLGFDPLRNPTAEFLGNRFYNPKGLNIGVTGSTASLIGTATIINNYFYLSAGGSAELAIQGGWQGEVSGNVFTVGQSSAKGIQLSQSGAASPGVSIRYNQFNIVNSGGRVALWAPPTTSAVTQIDALYNNWSYYTSSQIASIITDHADQSSLATVAYQPWTPSGGGGGGGGGCPFVLVNGDDGLKVENSILGRSVFAGTPVSDAYPLGAVVAKSEDRIRLRIAEMGSETDEIDALAVGLVDVPEGQKLATDSSGNPILIGTLGTPLRAARWTGKQSPSPSPVAPGEAFRGEAGDSVEFALEPADVAVLQSQGRIGVQLIPKPPLPAGGLRGEPAGITVRISPDTEGDRWFTLPPVIPREYWSTEVLPATGPGGEIARRIRVIWHSQHTLGWIGPVHATPVVPRILPCLAARTSGGRSALAEVQSRDGKNLTLAPDEYVDLEFDARGSQPSSQYVLLAHGRYFAPTSGESAPPVPKVYSLEQNRPNPFNPETSIEFGLPAASHVSLRVYDVSGRLVHSLVERDLPAGFHVAKWDGRGGHGVPVASGVYFYELRAGSFADRRRMILLR